MNTLFREQDYGNTHVVADGAPCEWSAERGATHTLMVDDPMGRNTRPAKLLKTRLYVGINEVDNEIIWEKWIGRQV